MIMQGRGGLWLEIISSVYLLIFDLLKVSLVMNRVLDFKLELKRVRLIIFMVLSILLLGLAYYVNNNDFYTNLNLILCLMLFLIFQQDNKKSTIFKTFLVYVVISAIDAIVYNVIRNIRILGENNHELWTSVLGTIVVLVLTQVYRKLVHQKLTNANKGISILSYCIVFLGVITAMYPTFIADENLKNSNFSLFFSLMSFLVIIGSALLIHFSKVNDEYRLQEEINKEKEKLLTKYYSDINKNNIEIRRFRHDYKNHIRSIKYLINEEKYDQLLEYIQEMDNTVMFYSEKVVDVGNEFVSAILSDYIEKSRKAGITLSVSGIIPEQAKVEDIDWSIILSNCINNAMEAVIKAEEGNREIDINFSVLNNKLFIEICNTIHEVPVLSNGEMKTTKPDSNSHGFGIKNIKSSVEKYHGNLSYQIVNNKKVITKIIMIF